MSEDQKETREAREPSEDELRAALEEEMKRVTVDDLLLQTIVSLINLGARRAGLAPSAKDERDLEQTQTAIDAIRALLPLLERKHAEQLGPVRDALAQLQMAFARASGQSPGEAPSGAAGSEPEPGAGQQKPPADKSGQGPAQRSGKLWVPGQ